MIIGIGKVDDARDPKKIDVITRPHAINTITHHRVIVTIDDDLGREDKEGRMSKEEGILKDMRRSFVYSL